MKHTAILLVFWSAAAFGQSANYIGSVGYLYPAPVTVAPGQVVTVFVNGLTTSSNITVTVQQGPPLTAPILETELPIANCPSIPPSCAPYPAALTVQIPYELFQPCPTPNACTALAIATSLVVTQDGATGAQFILNPVADHIHILTACDTVINGMGTAPFNGLQCTPLVTHADGSLVNASSPAQSNEEVIAYATGLGATNPAAVTGQPVAAPLPTVENLLLDFNFKVNALPSQPWYPANLLLSRNLYPLFSGLTPGFIGLYQINFIVPPAPAGSPACGGAVQSNLTVSFGASFSFDGAGICAAAGS